MSLTSDIKSYYSPTVIQFIAVMKRQEVALANILGTPKLKLFESHNQSQSHDLQTWKTGKVLRNQK